MELTKQLVSPGLAKFVKIKDDLVDEKEETGTDLNRTTHQFDQG